MTMRILIGGAIGACCLFALPTEGQSPAQLARLDSSLAALTTNGFSGVVLLAANGSVVFNHAYGMANRAAGTPMSTSSAMQIGSNTKDFTTVAILQLIEKGSLDMRDSLGKFFPEAPAEKRGITIDQLLHHMGGFDRQVGGDFEAVNRAEMVANAFRSRLVAKPGERRSYSNTGFNLLAAVIETVSGTSYDQYVRDRILSPLGLHDTGFLLPAFDPKRYVHGYRDVEDVGAMLDKPHAPDGPFWNLRGSGGMLSTSSDMFAFYRALFSSERLIRTATRDLAFSRSAPRFLAGSDLVHFFVYGSEVDGGESIIALNTTAVDPQRVRGLIDGALGKTAPSAAGGPQRVIAGGPPGGPGPQIVTTGGPFAMPETNAGRAAQAYVRAYNQGRPDVMRSYLMTSVAPGGRTIDERVANFEMVHRDLGFITPLALVASSDTSVTIAFNSVYDGPITVTFSVEPTPPYRLAGIQIDAGNHGRGGR